MAFSATFPDDIKSVIKKFTPDNKKPYEISIPYEELSLDKLK